MSKVVNEMASKYSKTAIKVQNFQDALDYVAPALPYVVKQPCFNPDMKPAGFCGLWTLDGQPVGDSSVSPKYNPHTPDDVLTILEASRIAFNGELSVDVRFNGGHQLVVMPTADSLSNGDYGNGDALFPRLSIFGGYAGKPFCGDLGAFRPICKNMLILQSVASIHCRIRHTLSMRDRLGEFVAQFEQLREGWTAFMEAKKTMEARTIATKDFLAEFFKKDEKQLGKKGETQLADRIGKIITRLMVEQGKLGQTVDANTTNGWMLWNAIQGAFQHDFTRKETDPLIRGLDTWNNADLLRAEQMILAV